MVNADAIPTVIRRTMSEIRLNSGRRALYALELRESGMTYREVGEHFGVTPERARQMAAKGRRIKAHPRFDAKFWESV